MTERIDKPNQSSLYQITPTQDSREHEQQSSKGGRDESSFRRISDWERHFLQARQEQKTVQIPLAMVREIRYQHAAIHHGSILFHVDLHLTDGTFQTGCLIQHPRIELFSKTQTKRPGDLLPLEWFTEFGTLFITLMETETLAKSGDSPPSLGRSWKGPGINRYLIRIGLVDPITGRPHIGVALLYSVVGLMVVSATWLFIRFMML